jgi:thiol:disulfide interchange protein DsbD
VVRSFRFLAWFTFFTCGLLLAGAAIWAQPARAAEQGGDIFGGAGGDGATAVAVAAEFTAPAAGQPGQLLVTATMPPGWHIYSITQPPPGPSGGPLASQIKLTLPKGVLVGAFQASPAPKKKAEAVFGGLIVETHEGTVTWRAPLQLPAGLDPAKLAISGQLYVQACDPKECYPPRDYPFVAKLGAGAPVSPPATAQQGPVAGGQDSGGPAATVSGGPAARLSWQPFTTIDTLGRLTGGGFDLEQIQEHVRQQYVRSSPAVILWFMAAGFLGGLILNIMPCVLPVIGLKILSFLEQAGHDRRKALLLNAWYSLGLLSVFVVLATLAISPQQIGWGQLFTKTGFTITLAAVVFVMGLSFLGVWELPIPGFAGRGKASELAAQEGAAGAFVKGALTTILATPCSAPFLAPAVTWAAVQPPLLTYAVLLSAGLGMASPYLLIGAFPQLIRFLPKPGPWMDTFKQLMGFVLLGTVVFIFTFLEFPLLVPAIGLLFGLWAACWWIGRISPLADGGAKARAWLEAAAFAGVVWILMFPGLGHLAGDSFTFGSVADIMRERFDRQALLRAALAPASPALQNSTGPKTVMVDFTADWCLTCKTLEATVLNTAAIADAVKRYGVVTLQADWTHEDESSQVTKMLKALGSKTVPVLAIFPAGNPNKPIILRGGYTQQMLLDALAEAGASK